MIYNAFHQCKHWCTITVYFKILIQSFNKCKYAEFKVNDKNIFLTKFNISQYKS